MPCALRTAEGERSGHADRAKRIEQLGFANGVLPIACSELLLKCCRMLRNSLCCERPFSSKHSLNGIKPVQARGVERRAEEPRGVPGVANAARRKAQIFEFGVPASNGRSRSKAGGRVQEGATFTCHRIFVPASEVEGAIAALPKRAIKSHEGMVSIDHDPWTPRSAESGKWHRLIEQATAAEQNLADEDQVMFPFGAAARNRSEKLSNGSAATRSAGCLRSRPSERTGAARYETRRRWSGRAMLLRPVAAPRPTSE